MSDYLFISDVHSQNCPLVKALRFALDNQLVPVLLGDIFDSRIGADTTYEVFRTLLDFPIDKELLLLHSNHQWHLQQRFQKGCEYPYEDPFPLTTKKLNPYREMIIRWFSALPLGITLTSSTTGKTYKVAHAYFPDEYEGSIILDPKLERLCLFGPRNPDNSRIQWWFDEEKSSRDYIKVAGHYHTLFLGKNSIILDGSCGEPGGMLLCYDTRKEKVIFP